MIIIDTIIGAIIGAVFSFAMYLFQCTCDIMSCNVLANDYQEPFMPWKICAIIGAVIGFIVGLVETIEKRKLEKEERILQEEEEKRKKHLMEEKNFKDWSYDLRNKFYEIEKDVFDPLKFKYDENTYMFMRHKLSEANAKEDSQRYVSEYNNRLVEHKSMLEKIIVKNIGKNMGLLDISAALNAVTCLYHLDETNNELISVYNNLNNFMCAALDSVTYMKYESYGNCYLDLDNGERMAFLDSNIDKLHENLIFRINNLGNITKSGFDGIKNYMSSSILYEIGEYMWYYAKKMPFNVVKFQEMQEMFTRFKVVYYNSEKTNAPVEAVLAQIYAKNQIGGESTARQDMKYIESWLLKQIDNDKLESCYVLASGLAWLELYSIEKDILNKMVELSVQLPLELQERLTLLVNGDFSKVTIYDNNDLEQLVFDDSSLEWNTPEFDMFFHLLEKKKINLTYSLVINKWTSNMPLKHGQKIDFDDLIGEFYNMIEEYDGEVTMCINSAKAINRNNLVYNKAAIFEFNSERNKCVTLLFACEKYGRNLTSTILVMYTPDENIKVSEQKNYALSIKNNIYIESFKESIYQCVDQILKDEIDIYAGM